MDNEGRPETNDDSLDACIEHGMGTCQKNPRTPRYPQSLLHTGQARIDSPNTDEIGVTTI